MFIKRTKRKVNGKEYINHLLVESVHTPKGPRHKVICSLGSLEPAPREQWAELANKLQAALSGQLTVIPDPTVNKIVEQLKLPLGKMPAGKGGSESGGVTVDEDEVSMEEVRAAGPVHVAHQMWTRIGFDDVLQEAGLSCRARILTEAMTLNRLVSPSSEHAMPGWINRSALSDILAEDFSQLADDALYRNLDKLHPLRQLIEKGLAKREKSLFNLDDSIYLYDLTSTYFEGDCLLNPQARHGYSRDGRPDCKQVVVGLVLGREGFPSAHEVFDGNRNDGTTVGEMLDALEERVGRKEGGTIVVDRGMASEENLKLIKDRGYHYIVASRKEKLHEHFDEFTDEDGWEELIREVSSTNPHQKKSRVRIKRACHSSGEVRILCIGEQRIEKDRAIREAHEKRLLADLKRLAKRCEQKLLSSEKKVWEAIGRLKERYSRVARYYEISFDTQTRQLKWQENKELKERAAQLDGGYLLRTDRQDLSNDEVWRTYMLLTRVESAFKDMKSPLMERPIFHQLEKRVQTHIFLCVLAYHLLVALEKPFMDCGQPTSWETIRQELSTHHTATVVLPTKNGRTLRIRKGTKPEARHREIYQILAMPHDIMKPVKTWT